MRAMLFKQPGAPLELVEVPTPKPQKGEVLIAVEACGVCRTDLHIVDGELPNPKLPLIPGHQIVGRVQECGPRAALFKVGDRIGAAWLGKSCQQCDYCKKGHENLCDAAVLTGYHRDGGFAEFTTCAQDYCFKLPEGKESVALAPLLCAGLIGYRAYRAAGEGKRLGFYGFGAAAHILAQLATCQGREVYAFTRHGDTKTQDFAKRLGAVWAGGSDQLPPEKLDAAILFAPVGALVPEALKAIKKGGRVVCAGIHMSDIPSFPYSLLWGERSISSVTNLTRDDGASFFAALNTCPVETKITVYPLDRANEALDAIRTGRLDGAAVLKITAD